MRRVILESPCAGDTEVNRAYAARCLRDAVLRGEAPYASHVLLAFAGALRDDDPRERAMGMATALEWADEAAATVVYIDLGTSPGMTAGIAAALKAGRPVEYRRLD